MKKYFYTWVLLLSFITSYAQPSTVYCDSVIVAASEGSDMDATIDDLNSNTPNGLDYTLGAERWTNSGTQYSLRGLIKFNMPNLPIGANISNAKLYLYYRTNPGHPQGNSLYPGSPYPLSNDGIVYRINQTWNPSTVTWSTQPTVSTQNTAIMSATSSQTQDQIIDVTNLVGDMYANPTTSFGFEIRMANESVNYRGQYYASSNHTDATAHPKLVVCYTIATPTTSIEKMTNQLVCIGSSHNKLEFIAPFDGGNICIYDSYGQKYYSDKFNAGAGNKRIVVNNLNLSNGIYFARVVSKEGISEIVKFGITE